MLFSAEDQHREERRSSASRSLPSLLLQLVMVVSVLAAGVAAAHPCERPCVQGHHMTCRYHFHVENYHSLSKACYGCPWNATDCARTDCIAADGVPRALVTVNRRLPGPSLQVCLGDRIEVTVHNHMPEQSTSVHWHGLQQHGTPYMDGVPFVTQCPIAPHATFRYSFRADNSGTQFWHSHTGCQRADGAVGFFTVRVPPEQNPHVDLYDEDLPDHGLLVLDWTHQLAASKFLAHHHAGDDNKADAVLINGKGVYRRFVSGQGDQRQAAYTPREVFKVHKGLRYRFRVVNAGFLNCPLELSVDNHTMLVIASDGFDIQPVRVDSLVSYAGERWDVIVEADQAVDNYWVRLHGLLDCGPRRAHEAAVLRYHGADPLRDPAGPLPAYDVPRRGGLQVNALNRGSAQPGTLTVAELRGLPDELVAQHRRSTAASRPGDVADLALKPRADVQLFVSYDFYALDNPLIHRPGLYGITQVANSPHRVFTPQLNHISLSLPPFPLLPSRDRIPPGMLCNETLLKAQGRNCSREYCECTHTVQVPLGAVLEIVLVDQGVRYDANHPFHLHGHAFRVVGLERLGTSTSVEEVQRLDAEGLLARNLKDPPIKDTVTVPDGGYTVLRVVADNPGYWLFHCHIEFHVELGMALVIKVGEHEDMPPVPRGFPQCGDWGNDWLGDGEDDGEDDGEEVVGDGDGEDDPTVSGNHIGRAFASPIHLSGVSSVSETMRDVTASTTTSTATTTTTNTSNVSPTTTTISSTSAPTVTSPTVASTSTAPTTLSAWTSTGSSSSSATVIPVSEKEEPRDVVGGNADGIVTASFDDVDLTDTTTASGDMTSIAAEDQNNGGTFLSSTEANLAETIEMDLKLYRGSDEKVVETVSSGSKFQYRLGTGESSSTTTSGVEVVVDQSLNDTTVTRSEVIMRVPPIARSRGRGRRVESPSRAHASASASIEEPTASGRTARSMASSRRSSMSTQLLVTLFSLVLCAL